MRFSECSSNEKWLLNAMRKMVFGEVGSLVISDGKPLKRPKPKFLTTKRLGCPPGKPKDFSSDFDLSGEQYDLIKHIRNFGDGLIPRIQIKNGLPVEFAAEMEMEEMDAE